MRKILCLYLLFQLCGSQLLGQDDTTIVSKLVSLSRKYYRTKRDTAMIVARQADSLLNKMKPSDWRNRRQINIYCTLASLLNHTTDYKSSLDYLSRALQLHEKVKDDLLLSNIYIGFGAFYAIRSNYPLALEYQLRALKIAEKFGDNKRICHIKQIIGAIYFYLNDFEKSEKYYRTSLQLARQLGDSVQLSAVLNGLATDLKRQNHFDEALKYLRECIYIDSLTGNQTSYIFVMNNIASTFHDQGKYEMALTYFFRILPRIREMGDPELLANILADIGISQTPLGQLDEAEKNLKEAVEIARTNKTDQQIATFESALSEVYEAKGNFNEALQHLKKGAEYEQKVYNDESKENMVRMEMYYDFGKQEEKLRNEHESEIRDLENKRKTDFIIRAFLIVVIVLTVGLLFFIKRAYDNKKRSADYLSQETQRKEVLLQEVHHRINNNLQVISSLLEMQAVGVDDVKLAEMLHQSQSRIESLSKLHEILFRNDTDIDVNIRDYIERVLDYHRDVIQQQFPDVSLASNIESAVMPTRDAVALALIVNELITNSCKHAFKNKKAGRITVNLSRQNGSWKLRVSDSGPGMSSVSGKEDGLGLRLINVLSKQLEATMNVFNRNGAVFELAFH